MNIDIARTLAQKSRNTDRDCDDNYVTYPINNGMTLTCCTD